MISVVVPAYNAEPTIASCLAALNAQTVQRSAYELIVVDDGSTDATARVAEGSGATVLRQANRGPAVARNRGIDAARGDIVLFTDSDCEPQADWIEQMSAPFADPVVAGVKGAYRTRQNALVARFVQLEYEDKYDRLRRQASIDFVDTYSAAYRRDILVQNNGFDPAFTTASVEDQELSFRLAQKGYRLVFAPNAIVFHRHNETLRQYARRKYGIGYWKTLLTRWHPSKLMKDSHTPQVAKLQIGLTALQLGSLPIALFTEHARWLIIAFTLAFAVTTVPFVVKALRKDTQVGLLAPFLLWVRALALGLGLLTGFAANNWREGVHSPVLSASQRLIKRLVDLIIGCIALLMCLPLWVLIGLLIKLDSRGPVLFVQERVGENGRAFKCYKFRTMLDTTGVRAAPLEGDKPIGAQTLKSPADPRVTRLGRVLRRTSLDETPNLINVLRGEMSLVGPRPEETAVVAQYTDWHRRRLAVKPGITGPMQINGRAALTLDERVSLELDYIEHYSLLRDVQIMLRTIPAVIRGDGAY